MLEVWYRYGKGTTLPSPTLETPHQLLTAVTSGTLFPGYDVTDPCVDYSYKVVQEGGSCRHS